MHRKARKIWTLLLGLAMFCSLGTGYVPAPESGVARAAEGGFADLNQEKIVEALGAGWNLGNQMEANKDGVPTEDYWVNSKVTERLLRTVKRSGFQSVRIPVSWLSLIGSAPEYKLDGAWLKRVQTIIDWAIKYDLYVIMNIHGDGYSTVKGGWLIASGQNQDAIKEKYEAVWKQLAEHFKDYDHHLIFESMNEVGAEVDNGKTEKQLAESVRACHENINDYNQIFVDTVRKSGGNNDKRWVLIPGWNTNIDYTVGDYGFRIPTDTFRSSDIPQGEQRIMVSVHYYSPWAFCGQEDYNITQWGSEAANGKTVAYQQEEYMEEQFTALKDAFVSKGYPVVIGEYGSIDKTLEDEKNTEFRAYYGWTLSDMAKKNGCVPVYWDNGWNGKFGFGIFDRTTYDVTQPEILAAVLRPYTEEVGTATAIALDHKSMTMDLADSPVRLAATLTPADAADHITWESSDTHVAKVGYQGTVTPRGVGTCIITATVPGGASAYCIVEVTRPESFKAGLYAGNSLDWGTIECDDYLSLSEDGGGTYTISMSGSRERMFKLTTLFIKDVTVQREVAEESILAQGDFTVDSLEFNGHPCTLTSNQFSFVKDGDTKVLDLCLMNYWHKPANCISEIEEVKSDQCYHFPEEWYVDGTNTLTMKVTISNAVLSKEGNSEKKPATAMGLSKKELTVMQGREEGLAATLTPADASEKVLWFSENNKIASVDQNGKVQGKQIGETAVHALTLSGLDQVCQVKVIEDDGSMPTPKPIDSVTPAPGNSATPAPGNSATPKPGNSATPKPGNSATPKPGNSAAPKPGNSAAPKPGNSAAPKPGNSAAPKQGEGNGQVLKKGSVFTAGKLIYWVSNTTAGKTAVTVKAPKDQKAKNLTVPATVKVNGVTYQVTAIGNNACKNCKKLKKITIGRNVASIGKNAFRNAKALKKITVKSSKVKKVGKNAYKGIHRNAVIRVPKKKFKKYRKLFQKKGQKKTVKIK